MKNESENLMQTTHPKIHVWDPQTAPNGRDGQVMIIEETIYVWKNERWEHCCLAWHPLSSHWDIHPNDILEHWATFHQPNSKKAGECHGT